VDRQAAERSLVMRRFSQTLRAALRQEDGITAVEYATILSVLMMIVVGALTLIGSTPFSSPKKTNVKESQSVPKRW